MSGQVSFADEPIRILCVDDERNVLRALTRMFIDDDYEILVAESAEEGLELLEHEAEVQLVISDYRMPGQNGVDFLREVCKIRPETVRIVLSGYADAGAIVSAINEGQIYKFIPKPWNDDDLRVTLDNALERYFLHKKTTQLMNELQESNNKLQQMNENLEALVEERTAKLSFQNQALQISQNILDSLPVGVLGLDLDGTIVQDNMISGKLMGIPGQHLVGLTREEVLPQELNTLVEQLQGKGEIHDTLEINNYQLKVWVTHMKTGEQEGIILTLTGLNN